MRNEHRRIQTDINVYVQVEWSFRNCTDVGEMYKVNVKLLLCVSKDGHSIYG